MESFSLSTPKMAFANSFSTNLLVVYVLSLQSEKSNAEYCSLMGFTAKASDMSQQFALLEGGLYNQQDCDFETIFFIPIELGFFRSPMSFSNNRSSAMLVFYILSSRSFLPSATD